MHKQEAVAKLLQQAPPGEFHEVLNDIRVLYADEDSLQSNLLETLSKYNSQNCIEMQTPEREKVICSERNMLNPTTLKDVSSGQEYKIDHYALKLLDARPCKDEPSKLREKILEYAKKHYPESTTSVNQNEIQIVNTKMDATNFWNARWHSTWTWDGEQIQGKCNVFVHFYEEGNVRMDYSILLSAQATDEDQVCNEIKRLESEHQMKLTLSFSKLSESAFKKIRRVLPVTRSKMDWSRIAAYKIASEIK